MPKFLILLIIITAWIISFLYPFFKKFLDEQELDLTYIGLLGLLIFIPFLIKNQNLPKNCPIKIYTIGILVFTPFVAMKFDIINLAVIFIYLNFISYIICIKGRRKSEAGD
jgi:hypothetical protein